MRLLTIPLSLSLAFAFAIGCDVEPQPDDEFRKIAASPGGGAECKTDAHCAAGTVCEPTGPACLPSNNACVPGCHEDTDCADDEFCQQLDCFTCPCPGECLPEDDGCDDDDDCAPGTVCEPSGPRCSLDDMECVAGCHDDADCGAGQICDNVECVTCPCPGNCIDDGPPPCKSDADCAAGTVCEPSFPGCGVDEMECVPGCHDDADCGPYSNCETIYCFTCPCPGQCD